MSNTKFLGSDELPSRNDLGDNVSFISDQVKTINTSEQETRSRREENQNTFEGDEGVSTRDNDISKETQTVDSSSIANNTNKVSTLSIEQMDPTSNELVDSEKLSTMESINETVMEGNNDRINTNLDIEDNKSKGANEHGEESSLLRKLDSNTNIENDKTIGSAFQNSQKEYYSISSSVTPRISDRKGSGLPLLNRESLSVLPRHRNSAEMKEATHKDSEVTADRIQEAPVDAIRAIAAKRKSDEMLSSYEPIDPTSFKPEKNKKRIAGKFIEKFWEPLDSRCINSIDKLLNMCVSRTIEKYKGNAKASKKMIEAQDILSNNWTNEMKRKSFRSRLNVTNVPLPSSMQSMSKSIDSDLDILNYDHLTRHMQFLETYLLAELKQLSDLESYYSDLEQVYNLDLNYLHEFRKTTEINEAKMIKETIAKQEILGLDSIEPDRDNVRLVDHSEIINSTFDPRTDKDSQEVLHLIEKHLQSLSSDTSNLTTLNEKLETLYNLLNKC